MNSISKSFPHPVLGVTTGEEKDISGDINLEINIERDENDRTVIFRILKKDIRNNYFNQLLQSKQATLLFKVYCSSTLQTFNFWDVDTEFKIKESEICNKIEIEPYIISGKNIDDYSDKSFSDIFGNQSFKVNKYDILGISGKITVPLDQKYEKLDIGNLFVFTPHNNENEPITFDLSLDKIHVRYPPTAEGEHPPNAMFHKTPWTAFNIFIIPALTEAFRIIQDPKQSEEAKDLEWYEIIDDLLPDGQRDESAFVNAQLILREELPVLKSYEELYKK